MIREIISFDPVILQHMQRLKDEANEGLNRIRSYKKQKSAYDQQYGSEGFMFDQETNRWDRIHNGEQSAGAGIYDCFQCIGSECEDTCCALWNVSVDQDTYNRYQKVQHPILKKKFKSDVVVNKADDRTQKRYATMKLEPTSGDCSFNDKGLCSIQKELGESYLSPTCATYPRKVNEVNGEQEVSAVLVLP